MCARGGGPLWTDLTAAAKVKDAEAKQHENLARSRKKIPYLPKFRKFLVQQNPAQPSSSSGLCYVEEGVKHP